MVVSIKLPKENGELYTYDLNETITLEIPEKPFVKREVFSAAHVVADPLADTDPINNSKIDWDATMEYRRYLWSLGYGVAEAMDTAQRGMGLDWETSKELIKRSAKEAKKVEGKIASGAGTDHLEPTSDVTFDDVEEAYKEQVQFVEDQDSQVILMASRALVLAAESSEDYERVYRNILNQVKEPVIIHWLGEAFDPALKGYWGSNDIDEAMDVCLRMLEENKDKIAGIKISLLDQDKEIKMRRLLPEGVKMYTGDDFNYPNLIKGDEQGYSDALLGIFDAIAPVAAAALHALDEGDVEKYDELLEKTVPLSRHIFKAPTYAYKTGVVFMAYLNGHQSHFRMVAGAEGQRSVLHLCELFVMADEAGLLRDPELAAERMKSTLELAGIKQ